jgi:hypothetical protein
MKIKESMKNISNQENEESRYITLTAIEDIIKTKKDLEGNDVPYIFKKNFYHKINVPIDSIGSYCQTYNSKGRIYKDRFVLSVQNLGMILIKGDFNKFKNKIHYKEKRIIVKGFGK